MLLYIIRHGDPNYATDSLTPRGMRQAEALARRLSANGLDEIYSSPLGRAVMTAQPTADVLKLPIQIEPWMSEDLSWDDLAVEGENGQKDWLFACDNTKFLKDGDFARADWHNHAAIATCKTAKQGYERIQSDSDEFLTRLGYKREGCIYRTLEVNNKRIAAFCHWGFGITWLSHLLSIPPLVFWASFNFSHSGVTILDFKESANGVTAPQCLCHSDLSHLFEARLPMEYNNCTKI